MVDLDTSDESVWSAHPRAEVGEPLMTKRGAKATYQGSALWTLESEDGPEVKNVPTGHLAAVHGPFKAWEEPLAEKAMTESIARGVADVEAGRVHRHEDVTDKIDSDDES